MLSFCKSEGGYSPFSMEYLKKTWAGFRKNVGGSWSKHGHVSFQTSAGVRKKFQLINVTFCCFQRKLGGVSDNLIKISAAFKEIILFFIEQCYVKPNYAQYEESTSVELASAVYQFIPFYLAGTKLR